MCGYNPQEHRFRFAAWAAGRAYGRGKAGLTVLNGQKALEAAGLKALAEGICKLPAADEFDCQHKSWCAAVQESFSGKISYGRAAKLVNVYLKALFLSNFGDTASTANIKCDLSARLNAIHPPIDRALLRALIVSDEQNAQFWRDRLDSAWTKFDQQQYLCVIEKIKTITGDKLWMIEEHWPGVQQ